MATAGALSLKDRMKMFESQSSKSVQREVVGQAERAGDIRSKISNWGISESSNSYNQVFHAALQLRFIFSASALLWLHSASDAPNTPPLRTQTNEYRQVNNFIATNLNSSHLKIIRTRKKRFKLLLAHLWTFTDKCSNFPRYLYFSYTRFRT